MSEILEIATVEALDTRAQLPSNGASTSEKVYEHDNDHEEAYSVFTSRTRTALTYLLGFVTIMSTLTTTIYFPLIPMLSKHFDVSIHAIDLTVTVYAICQALSPGIFASLADTYGRRPILLILSTIYACASLGLSLNKKSYVALIVLRALQSVGGSATQPIAFGIVADVAVVAERGKMLGPMQSTCNAISAVGPVIGGAVALSTEGYTWVFLSLVIIGAACLLLVGFWIPETARNVVGNGCTPVKGVWRTWWSMFHCSRSLRNDNVSGGEIEIGAKRWSPLNVLASLRIILHPDAAMVLWTISSSYTIYYTFQVAIPVIFEEIYGYNELKIGLIFLPGLAGMTIGGIVAGRLMDTNYANVARKHSFGTNRTTAVDIDIFPIEKARYRRIVPFVLIEIGLVAGYGWVVQHGLHPSIPIVMQFFICALSTFLSHTSSALLVDIFPDKPSTAYASGQIMRCGLSAASAAIIEPLVGVVGRGWYFTMFSSFTGLGCLLCVVVSRTKGMDWRQRRFARPANAATMQE